MRYLIVLALGIILLGSLWLYFPRPENDSVGYRTDNFGKWEDPGYRDPAWTDSPFY